MSEAKHTLKIVDEGSAEYARPAMLVGQYVVVHVDCRENYGDPLPFARLIAAAPELLEALRFVVRDWLGDMSEKEQADFVRDYPNSSIKSALAAIAKAEGRS